MKKITFFIAFLISFFGFSQDDIQTFETAITLDGGPFGNLTSATVVTGTGSNTTQVLEMVANPGGEIWQGVNLDLEQNVNLTAATTLSMTMDVLSSTPISFLVKVNDGEAGAPEAAAEVNHNGDGTWQTLTFTFNTSLDGKAAEANGTYKGFVVHAYWATGATTFGGVTADTRTFFIDNIKGPMGTSSLVLPTTAPITPPARAAADVVSVYGESYGAAVGLTNVPWDNANFVEESIASNNVLRIDFSGPFMGSDLNATTDGSDMTHFHMDYWIADPNVVGQVFNIKWSNHSGGSGETDSATLTVEIGPGDVQTWKSIDVPLSNFNVGATGGGIANRAHLQQFLITPSNTVSRAYIDNLYLHKNTTLSTDSFNLDNVSVFPNPSNTEWKVKATNQSITSVIIYDILGKQVISINPENTEAVIDASSLKDGLYLAKILTANGSQTVKLIKN